MNNDSKEILDGAYWNNRWQTGETGWDVGRAAPALTEYAAQLNNKQLAILIPGCGNAYEAEFLLQHGFTNVTLLDISAEAVLALRERFKAYNVTIICGDFFAHEQQYDLILEQTFFCALSPALRSDYVRKAASLLKENGKIVGVLFNREFDKEGPPFGGVVEEYRELFSPYFNIVKMEPCHNSIPPRQGTEVFIILQKK